MRFYTAYFIVYANDKTGITSQLNTVNELTKKQVTAA